MDKAAPDERAHQLAVKIYVELVARHTEVSQDSVKMAASATNLAALSIRLSETFLKAEADAILAKEPVKNYQLHADDFARWEKKPG